MSEFYANRGNIIEEIMKEVFNVYSFCDYDHIRECDGQLLQQVTMTLSVDDGDDHHCLIIYLADVKPDEIVRRIKEEESYLVDNLKM